MSNSELATTNGAAAPALGAIDYGAIEAVVARGDLSKLSPGERVRLYNATCQSLGLNPLTQPFQYISLSGKLTLYARRDCTDQLRKINGVSITALEETQRGDILTVKASARDKTGREDVATGAVSLKGLQGESLANAYMKAETKSKRRVTLSICGLGFLDETEVETIPDARPHYDAPQATSTLAPGGSPQTDAAFTAWLKGFLDEKEVRWADHWTAQFRGDPVDVGELCPSFRLRNHLIKWLGEDVTVMKHNHITRALGVAYAADPLRMVNEANSYLRRVWRERLDEVQRKFPPPPDDDADPDDLTDDEARAQFGPGANG